MPEKISLIESLHSAGDLEKLETEYHKLKGTGRTYGLPEFTQVGATLERICDVAPEALPQAVPLSLSLMARMRDARVQGTSVVIEAEPDFQTLVKIVEAKG